MMHSHNKRVDALIFFVLLSCFCIIIVIVFEIFKFSCGSLTFSKRKQR
ncbi:hypothetical protein ACRPOS_007000 [Bartonella heixiaziensis]